MSCSSRIRCRAWNPQPHEHELSPITIRPRLPPSLKLILIGKGDVRTQKRQNFLLSMFVDLNQSKLVFKNNESNRLTRTLMNWHFLLLILLLRASQSHALKRFRDCGDGSGSLKSICRKNDLSLNYLLHNALVFFAGQAIALCYSNTPHPMNTSGREIVYFYDLCCGFTISGLMPRVSAGHLLFATS